MTVNDPIYSNLRSFQVNQVKYSGGYIRAHLDAGGNIAKYIHHNIGGSRAPKCQLMSGLGTIDCREVVHHLLLLLALAS